MKKPLSFILAGVFTLVLVAQAAHPPHAHDAGLYNPHVDCGLCAAPTARHAGAVPQRPFFAQASASAGALVLPAAAVLILAPHFHHRSLAPPVAPIV